MISTVSQAKYLAHRLTKESKFGEIEKLIPVYLKSGIEVYFVIETKGTTDEHKLRPSEQLKIRCGREHFKALGNEIEYEFTKDWQELKRNKV